MIQSMMRIDYRICIDWKRKMKWLIVMARKMKTKYKEVSYSKV